MNPSKSDGFTFCIFFFFFLPPPPLLPSSSAWAAWGGGSLDFVGAACTGNAAGIVRGGMMEEADLSLGPDILGCRQIRLWKRGGGRESGEGERESGEGERERGVGVHFKSTFKTNPRKCWLSLLNNCLKRALPQEGTL